MILMVTNLSSAIILTEVELNPEGSDSGNEWVEIYSSEDFNLNGTYLKNKDEKKYNLTGIFRGYLVIQFESQWLDNSNESVYLFDSEGLIDETDIFQDSDNDNFAWSLCRGNWEFISSTKGAENNCTIEQNNQSEQNSTQEDLPENNTGQEEPPTEEPEEQTINEENQNTEIEFQTIQQIQDKNNEKIVLNPPKKQDANNHSYETKQENFRLLVSYAFSLLCVMIIIFISFRKL
ncbi:hypothetical protein AUJ84_00125 [Candidatus Pacearchaeota archaeon CG1_02_32_132]|nr:MAG: hypothetical protein AUJ84_00125 [Candidatus Pacearchaeota archaeon CG1_02_32_132]